MSDQQRTSRDKQLLQDLCRKHGVSEEEIEELLKVEKEYQLREKRHGIYEKLREVLYSTVGVQGNAGKARYFDL